MTPDPALRDILLSDAHPGVPLHCIAVNAELREVVVSEWMPGLGALHRLPFSAVAPLAYAA